jgi:hypothetical protein
MTVRKAQTPMDESLKSGGHVIVKHGAVATS